MNSPKRIDYLDTVKAVGIFLVYIGHIAGDLWPLGIEKVFLPWKFIYSFHMPLFFFLSGIFAKPAQRKFTKTLKLKAQTRLLPVLFFGCIAIPFLILSGISIQNILVKGAFYFLGYPMLNWVTWFIICLFTIEIGIELLARFFPISGTWRLIFYILIFSTIGSLLTPYECIKFDLTATRTNYWFAREAVPAASFYLTGFLLKNYLIAPINRQLDVVILLLSFCILLLTFNLNQGPFTAPYSGVLMCYLSHGNPLLFFVTAYAGIFFMVWLFRLIKIRSAVMNFVGQNTLIFMGLCGLWKNYYFYKATIIFVGYFPKSSLFVFLYIFAVTCIQMLLVTPFVFLLRRYFPELVGHQRSRTSLLAFL